MRKTKVAIVPFLTLLAVLFSLSLSAKELKARPPQVVFAQQKVAFQLGETTVHAQMREFGAKPGFVTLVNVHDDEQSSVEAGVAVLEKTGGRLIEFIHSGKRRIVFTIEGETYSIDPNRIFSPAGVRKTVRNQGSTNAPVPAAVHLAVDEFAAQFIRHFHLDKQKAFITLHNNDDGELSIHTYEPGGDWAADTAELHPSKTVDVDDFFFVTDKRIYEALKAKDANVILQDNSIKRDDGSLSVFAGRHGIRYINVEAEPTHQPAQIEMITEAVEIIR